MIAGIDYHITDICNLNCAHCSHFCPLVQKDAKHKSIEQITADLALMSKFKDQLGILGLMGGEAFLHPQLSKILRIARGFFPNTYIHITTNGTLADKILQWKDAIEENNIGIDVTTYPYKEDAWENYWKIKQVIPNTVSWCYPLEKGMTSKHLTNASTNLSEDTMKSCYKRWHCNQLKNGKLYICYYAAQLDVFKKAFPGKIKIEQDEKCYIDLNNDNLTIQDIENWQNNTMPDVCSHCLDVVYGNFNGPVDKWKTSTKDISEWLE